MADIEMEDIEIGQPKQLTDRQMSSLVSLWRLSHYRQAPLSSWTMLYTQRRPKRKSPMICFDTKMYKLLREQQAEDIKKKQAHQHQIWQHVQDRLAEHNQILEQEKAEESKKTRRQQQKEAVEAAATMDEEDNEDTAAPVITEDDSSTVTSSASTSPEATPAKKRSIRWGLQNNQTKRFDKTLPITLVKVPSVDTRPTKSALKVRTPHTIQSNNKQQHASKKPSTTITTDTKKSRSAYSSSVPVRKHAVDFF
ncbi:hypothetical protein EC957_002107 [Mortierella hygrophila]|uniref:Uncharacterized protein n=1 Tax=Mortierella hygrophila TaxID=979708 RepID=A0A9P6F523_9FUNG|nr:hypothetical protein EC957_002107 [Mortierella hygrophila]